MLIAKVLQSTALKCDDLVVETQSHVYNPPQRRLDVEVSVGTAVNRYIYRSDYQVSFGLQ